MAGNIEGGRKAAITNKLRYGHQFYVTIGREGGRKSKGGGFSRVPELASKAGRIGGLRSRGVISEEEKAAEWQKLNSAS